MEAQERRHYINLVSAPSHNPFKKKNTTQMIVLYGVLKNRVF